MSIGMQERLRFGLLAVSLAIFSWLTMQILHESGHVFHCVVSGGKISQVVLHPLAVSRTEYSKNEWPQFVAWGGIIWGSIIPIVLFVAMQMRRSDLTYLARFFAGFCLISNGVYFVVATIDLGADPGDLVRFGAPRPVVGAVGGLLTLLGFVLWNGLGRSFGLGVPNHRTSVAMSIAILMLATGIAIAEAILVAHYGIQI